MKHKPTDSFNPDSLTLGEYAHRVIHEQYQSLIKQEKNVLADKDPEHLHRMRVSTRRLRTGLQVFNQAIKLPKAAQAKQVGAIARILGSLRDLDVQIADLKTNYLSHSSKQTQQQLEEIIRKLQQQRRKAFAAVESALTQPLYQDLKAAYKSWLAHPSYTNLANLPLTTVLPELLSPLLVELLLHPGWQVSSEDTSEASEETLHDLRKAFKHARYQAEFFTPFYGDTWQEWLSEVKQIQEKLGKFQDSRILLQLVEAHLPRKSSLPELQQAVQQTRSQEMTDWEPIRQKYLDPTFRYSLYQLILNPVLDQ